MGSFFSCKHNCAKSAVVLCNGTSRSEPRRGRGYAGTRLEAKGATVERIAPRPRSRSAACVPPDPRSACDEPLHKMVILRRRPPVGGRSGTELSRTEG